MARIEITVPDVALLDGCIDKGAVSSFPWFDDVYLGEGCVFVEVWDPDEDDMRVVVAPLTFRFTADDIAAAVSELSKNNPTKLWRWHDPDTWDAGCVNMILQQAAFGEQVYG